MVIMHESAVNSVAFSDDTKLIVSCSDDCTVRVYNRETKEISILKKHT